jgi:Tfp pilus assembly protein PilZ
MPDQTSSKPPGDVDSTAPSSRNSRRAPRFSVDLEITLESEHNFYAGLVENLSASGLFIATHALRSIGEQIEFSIRLGESKDTLKGMGVVCGAKCA